jgi:hypothetical protein
MSLTEQQMDKICRIYTNILFLPAIVLHEFLHYLPAKVFRCDPKMCLFIAERPYTEFKTRNTMHMKVIGILPTVIGVLALPMVVPLFGLSPVGIYTLSSWALMTAPSMEDINLVRNK